MANVKVAVRIRPLNDREKAEGGYETLQVEGNCISLLTPYLNHSVEGDSRDRMRYFSFDYVYRSVSERGAWPSSQENIYRDVGIEALNALFDGYNACVLAHGQSGAGKTYTMMGTEEAPGLIPQICTGFFARVAQVFLADQLSFRTDVSYLEIYNEKVRDLLRPPVNRRRCHLRVREHPKLGPYVQDLSRHVVNDAGTMLSLVQRGNQRRVSAATHYHNLSSRSHAIFTIHCTAAALEGNLPRETIAKLHLVDLAGSERANKELSRIRLKEGSTINKSLVTLGNVINALAESSCLRSGLGSLHGSCHSLSSSASGGNSTSPAASPRRYRQPYIPYRDSVLTWLLKDSLGGNSRTVMVAAISPSSTCYSETLSTLRYASRTKHIVNRPVVNEEPNVRVIRELRAEVQRLKGLLHNVQANSGVHQIRQGGEILLELLNANESRAQELTQEWMNRWYQRSFHREQSVPLSLPAHPDDASAPVFNVQRRFSDTGVQTSPSHVPTREIEVEVTNSYFTLSWPAMGQSAAKENSSIAASKAVRLSELGNASSVLYECSASDLGSTDLIPVRDSHFEGASSANLHGEIAYAKTSREPKPTSDLLSVSYFYEGSQSLPTTPRVILSPEETCSSSETPNSRDLRRGISEPELEIGSSESNEVSRSSSSSSQLSQDSFFGVDIGSRGANSPKIPWNIGITEVISPLLLTAQEQTLPSNNLHRRVIPVRMNLDADFQNSPVVSEDIAPSPLPSQRRIIVDPVVYASPTYSSSVDSFNAPTEVLTSQPSYNMKPSFLLMETQPSTTVDSESEETGSVILSEDSLEGSQVFRSAPKPILDMDSLEETSETLTVRDSISVNDVVSVGCLQRLQSQYRYPSGELSDESYPPTELTKKKCKRTERPIPSRLVHGRNGNNSSDDEGTQVAKEDVRIFPRLRPKRQRALEEREGTLLPQSSSEEEGEERKLPRDLLPDTEDVHVLLLNHLPSVKRPPLAPFNTFDLEDPDVFEIGQTPKSPVFQRPPLVPCNTIEVNDIPDNSRDIIGIDTSSVKLETLNSLIDTEPETSVINTEAEDSLISFEKDFVLVENVDAFTFKATGRLRQEAAKDAYSDDSSDHFTYTTEDIEEKDFLVEYWEQSNDYLPEPQLTAGHVPQDDVNPGSLYTINEVPEDCSLPSQDVEIGTEAGNDKKLTAFELEDAPLKFLSESQEIIELEMPVLSTSSPEAVEGVTADVKEEFPQCLAPKHSEGNSSSQKGKRVRSRSLDLLDSTFTLNETRSKIPSSASVDAMLDNVVNTELGDARNFRQGVWQDMKQLLLGCGGENFDSREDVYSEISGDEIGDRKSKRKAVSWTDLSGCGTLETDMERIVPKCQEPEQQIRPIIKAGPVVTEMTPPLHTDPVALQEREEIRKEDEYTFYDRHRGRYYPKVIKRHKPKNANNNERSSRNDNNSQPEVFSHSETNSNQTDLISEACNLMTRLTAIISNLQTFPVVSAYSGYSENIGEKQTDDELDLNSPYLELCDNCFQLFEAAHHYKSSQNSKAFCPKCSSTSADVKLDPEMPCNSSERISTSTSKSKDHDIKYTTGCSTTPTNRHSDRDHHSCPCSGPARKNCFRRQTAHLACCQNARLSQPCCVYVYHVYNSHACSCSIPKPCSSPACSHATTTQHPKINQSCQTEENPRSLNTTTASSRILSNYSEDLSSSKPSVHLGGLEALSQQLLAMRRHLVAKTASRKTLAALRLSETQWL